MELTWEYTGGIGTGREGNLVFLQGEMLSTLNSGYNTLDTINGTYDVSNYSTSFDTKIQVIQNQSEIRNLKISTLDGFGAVGSYTKGEYIKTHVVIIHEFEEDIGDYIESFSIKKSEKVSSMNLVASNPKLGRRLFEEPQIPRVPQRLSPSKKIEIKIYKNKRMINLGEYFIDASKFDIMRGSVSVSLRDKTGRYLIDQYINNLNLNKNYKITTHIKNILLKAGFDESEFFIKDNVKKGAFKFDSSSTLMNALETLLKYLNGYKIRVIKGKIYIDDLKRTKSVIVDREREIISRNLELNDKDSYTRICARTSDGKAESFYTVQNQNIFKILDEKTKYISLPNDTTQDVLEKVARAYGVSIATAGYLQTMTIPLNERLDFGDTIELRSSEIGSAEQGYIKDITHSYSSKGGFTSSISLDTALGTTSTSVIEILNNLNLKHISSQFIPEQPQGG